MKNLLRSLMLLIIIVFSQSVYTQTCAPISLATPGFYSQSNDSVICITKGQQFTETIYFKLPTDAGSFTVQYVKFDSLTNIPSGSTYTFNKPLGSQYAAGESGCFTITGTAPSQNYFERINIYAALKVTVIPVPLTGEFQTIPTAQGVPDYRAVIYLESKDPNSICNLRISGNIFADLDNNCQNNGNDVALINHKVTLNGSKVYFTDANGIFTARPDTFGTHTIELDTSTLQLGCGSVVRTVNIQPQSQVSAGNDFAMKPDTDYRDLSVTLNPFGWWLFGFTGQASISYRNNAFVPVDATIRMKYDSITQLAFDSVSQNVLTSVTPSFVDTVNRIIEWQITNIPARTQGSIYVAFQLPFPTAPSVPIHDTIWIFPDSADAFLGDNIHITDNLITGAYDPNDKQVSPSGADGKIGLADSLLTYKVRFQNTGTGPAVNVIIKDTLDSDLNLISFRPGLASHPYTASLAGNVATFTFSNIMLPDSNANEPESHGFIQYSIKKKSGLGYGTVIDNSASIYFDFNEPIKTNTVTSTYFNFVSSVKDWQTVSSVFLYPNPATQKVNVVATEQINELVISNISGAILKQLAPANLSLEIDLSDVPSGIYFIAVKTANGIKQNRLIKY
jgi:uncharacterized repeat protein (TIGR01451 family)